MVAKPEWKTPLAAACPGEEEEETSRVGCLLLCVSPKLAAPWIFSPHQTADLGLFFGLRSAGWFVLKMGWKLAQHGPVHEQAVCNENVSRQDVPVRIRS
ncbi:hypothetical protein Droror1_Dr00011174 [Drosera rotundifolia]